MATRRVKPLAASDLDSTTIYGSKILELRRRSEATVGGYICSFDSYPVTVEAHEVSSLVGMGFLS